MRSELVFQALTYESNRYKLCRLVAKGTRKMHKPTTRVEDTTSDVLKWYAGRREAVEEVPVRSLRSTQEQRAA